MAMESYHYLSRGRNSSKRKENNEYPINLSHVHTLTLFVLAHGNRIENSFHTASGHYYSSLFNYNQKSSCQSSKYWALEGISVGS